MTPYIFTGLEYPDRRTINKKLRSKHDPIIVLDAVCTVLNIGRSNLISGSRKRYLVDAKKIAVGLIYQNYAMPLKAIGKLLGGMHHATVMYHRDGFADLMETDKEFESKVLQVVKYMNL